MDIIMPTWLFRTILTGYILVLMVLLYFIISNRKRFNNTQVILMVLVLLAVPVFGSIVVGFLLLRKARLR